MPLRTGRALTIAAGLTRDDETQRDARVALWDEFNRAWLVTLQRQFDLTEEMLAAGRPLTMPQSIMTRSVLDYLGRELVQVCDSIERHGLVDYQMGVAEDEIIDRESSRRLWSLGRPAWGLRVVAIDLAR